MIPWSLQEIALAVNGEILQDTPHLVTGITTDSRDFTGGDLLAKGQMFVPLRGEKFDGHAYIDAALKSGALATLTEEEPRKMIRFKGYIKVKDTQQALHDLAGCYRGKFRIPMVQVTGSAGKTTTKEMIASVLSQHFVTLKTQANFNNHVGTPMTLLNLEPEHEAAVIETGMSHFGEIRYLGEMVRPQFAVITNIGDAHIENMGGSRQGTLRAKSEIFENLQSGGVAVLNGDDPLLRTLKLPFETVWCGTGDKCNVRVTDIIERGIEGISCRVSTVWGSYDLTIPRPGGYMVYPAAMAIAIGERLNMPKSEILKGIAEYVPVGSRMHIIRKDDDRVIIDDCYNANPQAMAEALKILHQTPCQHRLAILGDMGELGSKSEAFHRTVGATADDYGDMEVIAIGEKSRVLAEEAKGQWFPTIDEALPAIQAAFTPGTVALVKASHAMQFTKIVKELS